jgi:aspartyl-tRNA(Asn)/glutamyl-tRNA(Gln) amidotransferase subunit C
MANFLNKIPIQSVMKVKIDKELIEHVSNVARLELKEEEKESFSRELKEILEAFSRIDEVDTKTVEIQLQPVDMKNALRTDTEGKCLSQEEVLSLTQHKKDNYFKGPRAV